MSGRGAAGAIVRTTIIIGGIFFVTSLALTSIANRSNGSPSGIERALEESSPALNPEEPADLFDPTVPLLGNETIPETAPGTSVVVDPAPTEIVPPAEPVAEPETAPAGTNPQ
jgi:preprotein translocase subunit SecG